MGCSLHVKHKEIYERWVATRDDTALLGVIGGPAELFATDRPNLQPARRLKREDPNLICYEYLTT